MINNIVNCPKCKSELQTFGKVAICRNPKCDRAFCLDNNELYESHCWCCHSPISNSSDIRCGKCKWYICPQCGAHKQNCDGIIDIEKEILKHDEINFFDPTPDYIGDYDDLYNTF